MSTITRLAAAASHTATTASQTIRSVATAATSMARTIWRGSRVTIPTGTVVTPPADAAALLPRAVLVSGITPRPPRATETPLPVAVTVLEKSPVDLKNKAHRQLWTPALEAPSDEATEDLAEALAKAVPTISRGSSRI